MPSRGEFGFHQSIGRDLRGAVGCSCAGEDAAHYLFGPGCEGRGRGILPSGLDCKTN